MKKKLPIGIESFSEIIQDNYYYVDKTNMIKELILSKSKVTLFTRPRRFGKSLNMDMLKTFFKVETDVSLFNGLDISNEKELCEKYQGKFPVILISLKDIDGESFKDFITRLKFILFDEISCFDWLMESDKLTEYDKVPLRQLLLGDFEGIVDLPGCLKLLCRLLYKHYGKKTIILVDEYDVPLDRAYQRGFYNEMVTLLRLMFGSIIKTNTYLEFAVLTGCLRVSKESIFTGMNNFKTMTISDNNFSGYFGFTDKEVSDMLKYYGLEDKYIFFKEWYNGYRFGNTSVYCPWDVINQCDYLYTNNNFVMKPYWINSSGNSIIKEIIKNSSGKIKKQLEALVSGESIQQEIIQELTYSGLDNTDNDFINLWSLLYTTGYLTDACTPAGDMHTLIIPNLEIYKIYEKQIMPLLKERIVNNSEQWKELCKAIYMGDASITEKFLNSFLFSHASIRDTYYRKDIKENFYHGFLLQTLSINDLWYVRSNVESGTGYPDIIAEDEKRKTGWVFELKYAEERDKNKEQDKMLKRACEEAMEQIKVNDYTAILRKDGMETIYAFGIAFCRKQCKVICRQENNIAYN